MHNPTVLAPNHGISAPTEPADKGPWSDCGGIICKGQCLGHSSPAVSEPSENNNKEITTMNKTTTRAKFSCKSIDQTDDTHRIKFEPVFSGSDENRDFFKWTPGGSIDLQVVGNDTAAQFQVGHDYYVDFSDAE
jgi:hypothetical protein